MFLYGPQEVVFKRGTKSCESDSAIKRTSNCKRQQVYRLINNELNPDFKSINPSLYDIAILRNIIGEPSYIIGSGLSGEPSAADINGQ
jgi:hypothetical protein